MAEDGAGEAEAGKVQGSGKEENRRGEGQETGECTHKLVGE